MPPRHANGHISATGDPIHFMFGSKVGFSGTADRMALRSGSNKSKMAAGKIATGRPIHFMFGSRVGFSGTADLMALFSVRTHPRWRPPPSWIISNCHIPATAHTIHLCRAHRAVIFAIAQLSCMNRLPYKILHHSIFDDMIIIPILPRRRNGEGWLKYIFECNAFSPNSRYCSSYNSQNSRRNTH